MTKSDSSAIKPQRDTSRRPGDFRLGHLNQAFHECLEGFAGEVSQAMGRGQVPILLRVDDRLILSVGDSSEVFEINGRLYHVFKALAHLPLLAFLIRATHQCPEEQVASLQQALQEAHERLDWDSLGLGDLQELSSAIRTIMVSEQPPGSDKEAFATVSALQIRCVELAARDEVARLCDAVQQVRTALEPNQWDRIHIVVCGGHQPRYKQLSKNFFIRLLRESRDVSDQAEHRVIYSENCQGLDDARSLVADRLVNGRLAEVFLKSPVDLDEDVLGDAGLAAIESVFAQDAPPGSQ